MCLSHVASRAGLCVLSCALLPCACRLYELYCDYVLKNPFYEIEQVIKCELFDENVEALLKRYPAM